MDVKAFRLTSAEVHGRHKPLVQHICHLPFFFFVNTTLGNPVGVLLFCLPISCLGMGAYMFANIPPRAGLMLERVTGKGIAPGSTAAHLGDSPRLSHWKKHATQSRTSVYLGTWISWNVDSHDKDLWSNHDTIPTAEFGSTGGTCPVTRTPCHGFWWPLPLEVLNNSCHARQFYTFPPKIQWVCRF